ncbi:MAG: hypothetical protein CMI52_04295 [Parcubacteria group bacterium]|nr:hypothetical protein [Parcubacteria group bacterium]
MKTMKKIHFAWILLFAVQLVFFVALGVTSHDPDFGWHLRVGQDIVADRDVPRIENYTYPTLGESWVDHEWASNLIFFGLYDLHPKFGLLFLAMFISVCAVATFAILTWLMKQFVGTVRPWIFFGVAAIFNLLILIFNNYIFGIRAQVFSWLFFALLFLFSYFLFERKKVWPLIAFPVLMMIWTNFHGSFILGLALVGLVLLLRLFGTHRGYVVLSGLACIVATFLTPYGIELWKLIVVEYGGNTYYHQAILEWLPILQYPFHWPSFWVFVFVVASLFFYYVHFGFSVKNARPHVKLYMFVVVILMVTSWTSRRIVPLLIIFAFPIVGMFYTRLFEEKLCPRFLFVVASALFVWIFVLVSPVSSLTSYHNVFDVTHRYPRGAVQYIRENPELKELNMFNKYHWGGYLGWMLQDHLLFVDGRMPQKPMDTGLSYLEEYTMFRKENDIAAQLDLYDVGYALWPVRGAELPPITKIDYWVATKILDIDIDGMLEGSFVFDDYMQEHWREIYRDDIAVIYQR